MLIFVPIPRFSTPLSPFIIVSNILNYQLPQNLALGAPKLAQTHKKLIKLETKRDRILIFVHIPPFPTPLSPVVVVSSILDHRLPQNYALGDPKLSPNPPKMGKIIIFLKLKGLECSFLFLFIYIPTH